MLRIQPTPSSYCSWVERWDDGGESCAVLCCAAAVRVACVCFHRGNKKNVVLLPESAPESYQRIKKYVLGKKSAQVIVLGKAIYHAGRYV